MRFILPTVLTAALALAAPGLARARMPDSQSGPTHTLTVVNGSPREIVSIFVSPTRQSEWGDDRLGDEKLPVGHRFDVDAGGGCKQDVRVVFDNKSAEEKRELDICSESTVNVHPGWTTEGGAGPGEEDNRIRYRQPAR